MICAIDQISIAHQLRRNIGLRNWKMQCHSNNLNCAIENPSKTAAQLMMAPIAKAQLRKARIEPFAIRRQLRKRARPAAGNQSSRRRPNRPPKPSNPPPAAEQVPHRCRPHAD